MSAPRRWNSVDPLEHNVPDTEISANDAKGNRVVLTLDEMQREVETDDDVLPRLRTVSPLHSPSPQPLAIKHQNKKIYVVFHGRTTGIFDTWPAASRQTSGFPHARHKSYSTLADAKRAYAEAAASGLLGPICDNSSMPPPYTCTLTTASRVHSTPPSTPQRTKVEPLTGVQTAVSTPFSTRQRIKKEPVTPLLAGGVRAALSTPLSTPIKIEPVTPSLAGGVRTAGSTPAPRCLTQTPRSTPACDDENWWVVGVGNKPGVYKGRAKAFQYAGTLPQIELYENCEGLEDACCHFIDLFTSRCIRRLENTHPGSGLCLPSDFVTPPIPLTPTPNDGYWYVVPKGIHPGVYQGRRTASRMASGAHECMIRCESERMAYLHFVELYMAEKIQE